VKLTRAGTAVGVGALSVLLLASACSSPNAGSGNTVMIVAGENEYADVASQIGGDRVTVDAILSDPNTDPHTFEADPSVARTLSQAQILVENGVGYDHFMIDLANASPNDSRKVISAQQVLGLPDNTDNPHLWYDPKTMPAVAQQIANDLGAIDPAHQSEFQANLKTFDDSIKSWTDALATFRQQYAHTPVAVIEPVADYMLQAAGVDIKTPWSLQAAIMNGTDPSPQDAASQEALLTGKQVKVFLYNQQVTDDITTHYLSLSKSNNIPVVGVYETMPPGYTFQKWMEAELTALQNAIANGTSTEALN
jgi:zinc/manganese transport system substrate-binding protein